MSFRKLKKAFKKLNDGRSLRPTERLIILDNYAFNGEKRKRVNGLMTVGDWIDDLIWCPSQCYLKIIYRHRWFIIYLRWRSSDPWTAELVETANGNITFDVPGWDMHDNGYEWRRIPVSHWCDDQLDELKREVVKEVKLMLPRI